MSSPTGLILSAPSSGSGKTTLTLGLLRALSRRGVDVSGAKSGPDYIDPRFHAAACGRECPNLDAWAMGPARLHDLARSGAELLLIEGAMGLFDGAPPEGRGATADLARIFALPVVLVVDCARLAHSVAPLVNGFAQHDSDVRVAGVILNHVGSPRHEAMLRASLQDSLIPVLGAVYRQAGLEHPSRHLGLVQAEEHPNLQAYLNRVADVVEAAIDLDALVALAGHVADTPGAAKRLPPPGQRIAVASDKAFAFAYPHILADWRAAGAEVLPFSPLADDAPAPDADFIFLPGGYPELHAGKLAAAQGFKHGMKSATCPIYGECGGYMTLGRAITDKNGNRHEMLGLLGLETSFAKRKLHLGYRALHATDGPFSGRWNAHEFHYATTLLAEGAPLFDATDAEGRALAPMGLIEGHVSGSFAHLIDQA
ncbi:cobyrinic acid a,c-diamide synthase [Aliiroseovarius halocynthiae]|uniref:Hydrogenobyrinate a,c-diamide synthase n=1 Tax=Aliiroseovarius halocynthiae TaxID=985055 RepID=A0A545SVN2_9RHOB|nr:cobyrinate a,c-diamide synthase [Aliiroseovarius halocynthiae]TQV69009.1 cobyrinate a,c-diamide synthase [Aliiroseovarius halocynthiae]SMR71759.1 cobyrinic acid a,c-diamide synthase [Aliiroseovarius halocynthiae]